MYVSFICFGALISLFLITVRFNLPPLLPLDFSETWPFFFVLRSSSYFSISLNVYPKFSWIPFVVEL